MSTRSFHPVPRGSGATALVAISVLGILLTGTPSLLYGQSSCVPLSRLQNMTKGEKVGWCGAGEGGTAFDWDENNILTSAARLKSHGFRHVRINMEMGYVWNTDCNLNMTYIPTIKKYMDDYLAAGLCVMLDPIHGSTQNGWSNKPAYNDPDKLKCLWNTFANYFKNTDPEKVFFELYNEPCCDAVAWSATQKALVPYVRAIVPNHTLILTASLKSNTSTYNGAWDHIGAMIFDTEILPDKNVVYSIHFYDPFEYTHQCLQSHGCGTNNYPDASKGWNKAFIDNLMVRLYNWSNTNNVAVHCGEFGDDYGATGAEVVAYANDMLDVLNKYNIPWTNWMCEIYDRAATDPLPTFTRGVCGSSTNQSPVCSITSPSASATFTAPASITITASASDPDGSITKVDFYQGTTLIGTDSSSPYSYAWTGVAAGTYGVTAKATDNAGASTTSSPVSVTVTTPGGGTVLVIEDNASGWTYTAGFDNAASANASGGTVRSGWQTGASMSRTFVGTAVQIYGIKRLRAVSFDVQIDGVTVGSAISTNGPDADQALLWSSGILANSSHTIKIITNGDWVDIDFTKVTVSGTTAGRAKPIADGLLRGTAFARPALFTITGAAVRTARVAAGGLSRGLYLLCTGTGIRRLSIR